MELGRNTLPSVQAHSVGSAAVGAAAGAAAQSGPAASAAHGGAVVPEASARPQAEPPAPAAEVLAGALHEVSNALTVVMGWLDEALTRDPTSPVREALEVARAHAAVGYRLAREGIGAEAPSSKERSAAAIARDAALGIQPQARGEGVEVSVEIGAAGAMVGASAAALQILVNLLLNAIAFTPRGARVSLALREAGGAVVFRVTDEGPGVAPERAGGLLSGPCSTRRGGAGIGLTHSAALAAEHGGRLELVRPGPGAVFELTWPVCEAASGAQERPSVPPSLVGRRVLVVEDDAHVLALVEISLEARGAQVLSAICPFDTVELLGNGQTFDVAVIDLSPFSDDPSDALARLRDAVTGAGIVLMSGHVGELPPALEGKVARWVRKPFEMAELVAAVEGVVRAQG